MPNPVLKIETGIQLLSRLTKKPNVVNFYPHLFESGPKSGNLVEMFSESCMSHLLIDIVTEALLKEDEAMGVLIFNTDGNLNIEELISTIKKKILYERGTECSESELDIFLNETMSNLHILDIYDATQFYTTIYNMETILTEHPNITLTIFNTLTAFYWSEQGYKITKMDLYIKSLIHTIQKITKEHKTVCIYTRPEYFSSLNSDAIEVDYQIQVLDLCQGNYQINIKSTNRKVTKFCKISNKKIQWL